jgi:tetratricopeptide (TPR) repeat protein
VSSSRDSAGSADDPNAVTRRTSGPEGSGVVTGEGAGGAADAGPRSGDILGRYVVVDPIGRGAMGVVVRAYDPKLRREVALKLVQPHAATQEARARLVREAQALARLAHPNVVGVFDVEDTKHGVCIALEYVDGQDLQAWLASTDRTWREVLAVMLAAGRGLAAAHAAGLVHRDIKPGNILVGRDGRVCVSDFGLARGVRRGSADRSDPVSDDELPDDQLTEAGMVMGTPAYMAPEQHLGDEADARADLYALSVTAWQAWYGERPFSGKSLRALFEAKQCGPTTRLQRSVPGWIRDVLVRGLATRPDERWPSVDDWVAALERGEAARRRRRVVQVGAGVGALVLAGVGAQSWAQHETRRQCEAEGAAIDEVWNDDSRARVRSALTASENAYGDVAADKVMPWLDAQSSAWTRATTEACVSFELRHERDAQEQARAEWCLSDRRAELEALVESLSTARDGLLERAVPAASNLSPIDCEDPVALARMPIPAPEQREPAHEVQAAIARAAARHRTGDFAEGLAIAQEAVAQAETLGWAPLTAAARQREGSLLGVMGRPEEALQALEDAYFEAARVGASRVAAGAAIELVFNVGSRLARPREGLQWVRHHEVAMANLPDPAGLGRASRLAQEAVVREAMGEYPTAKALHEEALALRTGALGPDHPLVATSLNNLGNVLDEMGEFDEALAMFERTLEIRRRALGDEHPEVASALVNQSGTLVDVGKVDEAREALSQALTIRERVLGPDHINVAYTVGNLGRLQWTMGDFDGAEASYLRALSILEPVLGSDHPHIAVSLGGLATVHQAQGHLEEARPFHERALAIEEKAHGPEHPQVASTLNNLGHIELELGRHDKARAYYERSLAIREKALGPDHPAIAYTMMGVGELAYRQARYADAVTAAERALAVREAAGASPSAIAQVQALLAQARWELGPRERADAVALAEEALRGFEAEGEVNPGDIAVLRAWHGEHAP